jgi:hypothetical protein
VLDGEVAGVHVVAGALQRDEPQLLQGLGAVVDAQIESGSLQR